MYSIDSPMRVGVPTSVDIGGKGACNNLMLNNKFELIAPRPQCDLQSPINKKRLASAPNAPATLD
jgi:hypothetical protein